MAGAYFTDGTTSVALGEVALVRAGYENKPIMKATTARLDAVTLETGGDVAPLQVVATHRAANAAEAEQFAYESLLALGGTGPGALVVNGQEYPACYFREGRGLVAARCEAQLTLEFLESARERPVTLGTGPGEGGAPSAPQAPSPGLWTFGGTQVGDYAAAQFAVEREALVKEIPRCYGARVKDARNGRVVEITLTAWTLKATREALEKYIYELTQNFGCAPRTLVGNGNSYGAWHLLAAQVASEVGRDGEIRFRFRSQR
jgi:hypothetical protein